MDSNTIQILQLLLTAGVIPATLFAFKLKSAVEKLSEKIEEQGTKQKEIYSRICHIENKIEQYEEKNENIHKEIFSQMNELDKKNAVEHAIMSNGKLSSH